MPYFAGHLEKTTLGGRTWEVVGRECISYGTKEECVTIPDSGGGHPPPPPPPEGGSGGSSGCTTVWRGECYLLVCGTHGVTWVCP